MPGKLIAHKNFQFYNMSSYNQVINLHIFTAC